MEPITGDSIPELAIPLSMGVRSDDLVFVSGQGPLDLETGEVADTVTEQTEVTLGHVDTGFQAAGLGPADVIKSTPTLTTRTTTTSQ